MNQHRSDSTTPTAQPSGGHWLGLAIVLLATAMQLWAVLQSRPLQSANDRSRWCTVWSLVERGTYHIDEIDQDSRWSTIDKVRHRDNDNEPWHFYSSKPPLFPTMVAGLYWLQRHTLGYDLFEDTALVSRMLLVVVNVLPMLLALLSFRKSLALLNVSTMGSSLLLITAGFASMLNPFLTTLNNHTPAAVCVTFCLAAMIRLRALPVARGVDFAIVGASAALSCCFELPAALLGVISFLYVVQIDWRKTARYYVLAALIPLAAFFVTNIICTGGIKPFYTFYGTEKYVYVHEGVPSYWSNPQGIDANTESTPVYLFHCVLGHHGILSLTPVFLLTLFGWLIGIRPGAAAVRPVYWIGAGLSLAVLAFYLSRTQNYNYGGNSATLRWMLWLTPFWWYGMIPAVERLVKSVWGNLLVVLLLVPSIYSPLFSIHEPWRPGWIFQQMEQRGLIDYRTKIPPFDPPRYSLFRQRPQTAGVTTRWVGSDAAAGQTITMKTLPAVKVNGLNVLLWQLSVSASADVNSTTITLIVLPGTFESGKDIGSGIMAVRDDVSLAPGVEVTKGDLAPVPGPVLLLLRGLPTPRPYNIASPRYLKYTRADGEKTAIRCDRAASRVKVVDAEHGPCWYRTDVLYNDDLPFGLAQWAITITTENSNTLIRREIWSCMDLP